MLCFYYIFGRLNNIFDKQLVWSNETTIKGFEKSKWMIA